MTAALSVHKPCCHDPKHVIVISDYMLTDLGLKSVIFWEVTAGYTVYVTYKG